VGKQPPRDACVFRRYRFDAAQGLQRPQADIPEISNRGGHYI